MEEDVERAEKDALDDSKRATAPAFPSTAKRSLREASQSCHEITLACGFSVQPALCYLRSMARQTSKPPTARVSSWSAMGSPEGQRRFLTKAQFAELRRKRADVYAKLRQMTEAERERRR